MRISRLHLVLAVALFGLSVASQDAWAKKDKGGDAAASTEELTIEVTGIASFDSVFGKAKSILDELNATTKSINDANANLVQVLALPAGTPVADALADLQKKAEGKIKVALNGTTPKLQASDAVPQNVTDAINACNNMVDAGEKALGSLQKIIADGKALVSEVIGIPPKITAEVKAAGIPLKEIPSVTKKINHNVDVVKTIPDAATNLTNSIQATFESIKSTFK